MTIEGNKDEADRCITIAQNAFSEGNNEKAEKFLLKAERLYPSARAKELLTRVRAAGPTGAAPKRTPPSTPNGEDVRRRKTPAHQPPQREYTSDQIDAVRRINTKCKDYYEILGVAKDASDGDIKKAYKKLALQLHPDKNHAPGAAEAFKAIGNAAAILTDPDKRNQYDLRGKEPAQQHTHHQYYARGFESDLTAEELFNMFFGATGGGPTVYTRRRAREPEQREAHAGLVQLLPVLVLVLLSMMSGFFISEPVFSLTPTAKHPVPRETNNLKVPYYVKENFHTDYQGSLRRLEMAIEEEYIVNLRHACQRERNYRDSMAWKARHFGDARQYAEAQKLRTPSCEKLQSFQR
ncbi:dnaJ homolog subfamily B member 12 isoform X2 [Pectinophora gossypiella]|uniref:dnaJ homolog subfamily B member 12 isoform X2 n=1 Tax=Pectinophora gossypiella TaxID=13191 RepID=UPI00214EE156|nr:dnaJ homolog subfamily B member 12 isoform X2 [Pectinophora gossypiella]